MYWEIDMEILYQKYLLKNAFCATLSYLLYAKQIEYICYKHAIFHKKELAIFIRKKKRTKRDFTKDFGESLKSNMENAVAQKEI